VLKLPKLLEYICIQPSKNFIRHAQKILLQNSSANSRQCLRDRRQSQFKVLRPEVMRVSISNLFANPIFNITQNPWSAADPPAPRAAAKLLTRNKNIRRYPAGLTFRAAKVSISLFVLFGD
jgi:hypothetical protein